MNTTPSTGVATKPPISPSSTPTSLIDLPKLAERIEACQKAIDDYGKEFKKYQGKMKASVIDQALKAGELLLQVKNTVGHGNFGDWLAKFCNIPERTAQRYMLIKQEWPKIEKWLQDNSATVADLTLRHAEQLAKPKTNEDEDNEDEEDATATTTTTTTTKRAEPEMLSNDPLSTIRRLENNLIDTLKTLRHED